MATFHNDKTLITFENTTGQTQYISKGAKVAILDIQSKDGGMTNFKWDIPTDDEGNSSVTSRDKNRSVSKT